MQSNQLKPRKSLNKAFLKVKPISADLTGPSPSSLQPQYPPVTRPLPFPPQPSPSTFSALPAYAFSGSMPRSRKLCTHGTRAQQNLTFCDGPHDNPYCGWQGLVALWAGDVWINQGQVAAPFDPFGQNRGQHIKIVLDEKELRGTIRSKEFLYTCCRRQEPGRK